jgi:hypothetical protein
MGPETAASTAAHTHVDTQSSPLSAEKRSAAGWSVLAAFVMTALKLLAGLLTGSLGLLSDAAHSGLDLLGAALTYFSVRISDKPADEDHPYGHGKIETLSAFTETFLMAVSCIWIVSEAVMRIFVHPVALSPCSPSPLQSISLAPAPSGGWRSALAARRSKPMRYTSRPTSGPALRLRSDCSPLILAWSSISPGSASQIRSPRCSSPL